jgi:hypothetical protein
MNKKSRLFGAVFIIMLLLCMIPKMLPAASAQPPAPSFWVDPATETFTTDNAAVGTLFSVTVWGSVAVNTAGWCVQLGFDSSELQVVSASLVNDFFPGHTYVSFGPQTDNEAGTILAGEILLGNGSVEPMSGRLITVTFEITAAPAQGESLTSLIDPRYGVASGNTLFFDANYNQETPLSIAPCAYTFCDRAASSQDPTFVSCFPNPVFPDQLVICTATVSGVNPTGTITWSSNSSTGSFNPPVNIFPPGIGSTTYTDTGYGTVTITASYSGDANNAPSNASTILKIQAQESLTYVSCFPNPVLPNAPVTCAATVSGDNPTGTITWSSNSSTGYFSGTVCALSYGYCSTTYTDSNLGTVMITASYSGDPDNMPSSGSTTLIVSNQPEQSWTYVYSYSVSTYTNSPVTFVAGVNGYNPTGTITWSSSSSTGSFDPTVSTLSSGTCTTTYTDSTPGTVSITATYSGDQDNAPSSAVTSLTLIPEPVLPPEFLLNVPYHHQITDYDCGPAALEEVFNYYGPDVPQGQIMDVARTTSAGTYDMDVVRAAQFSNLSSTTESQIRELHPFTGYPARSLGYAALQCYGMSIEELKAVIAAGYPVMVLTSWHFRVAVGYTDQYIIFQDPYYGSLYEMTYAAFSSDWDYSDHEGMLVCPWQVQISNPHNVMPGDTFTVDATVTYPQPYPFQSGFACTATSVNATITLPSGLTLAPGETAQKTCESMFEPGQSFTVSWQVQCQSLGGYSIGVEAEGLVDGGMSPEPPTYTQGYSYQDRIGGTNASTVAATSTPDTSPPVTTEDYNGAWQNQPFTINLTASDDNSGVYDSYYSINNGPTESLSVNGQPTITTPGANNTLQYWSVDWAGNTETPHTLTGIMLDTTPPTLTNLAFTPSSNVQPHQTVNVTVQASDPLSGTQNVTLLYSLDNGASWMSQPMNLNPQTMSYEATLPGQPAGTAVSFYVTACDQAGNTAKLMNDYVYFTYEVAPLSANMTCTLQPLNLGFNEQWLAFCLTPPEGYSPGSVNAASISLNGAVSANASFASVTIDETGMPALLISFNRTAVSQLVTSLGISTGNVTLSFNGKLNDGSLFEGNCTLCVRMPGDVNMDGKVDIRDLHCIAQAYGSRTGQPGYKSVLDENEDGRIDIRDVALVAKNYGRTYP